VLRHDVGVAELYGVSWRTGDVVAGL
jgi:hypothetical protein